MSDGLKAEIEQFITACISGMDDPPLVSQRIQRRDCTKDRVPADPGTGKVENLMTNNTDELTKQTLVDLNKKIGDLEQKQNVTGTSRSRWSGLNRYKES